MNLLKRSTALLAHSKADVLADPSKVKELTEIFRFRGENICSACPGVLSAKLDELNRIVQSGNFNNIFMAKKNQPQSAESTGKSRRYMLPEGKHYRPFGLGVVYTNDNITDEVVEKLIAENPSVKNVFIDLHAQEEPPAQDNNATPTLDEVKAKYRELMGEDAPADLGEEELREVVAELASKE